jgi:hypothetical protein
MDHRLLHFLVGAGLGLSLLSFNFGQRQNPFGPAGAMGVVLTAGVVKEMYDNVRCAKTPASCESTSKHLGDIGATVAGGTLALGLHFSFGHGPR